MGPEVAKIVEWICAANPQMRDVDPDADLIESRIIGSLAFAEYLGRIEALSGRAIDPDTLDLEDLRTLRRLEQAYFTPGSEGAVAARRDLSP